MTKLADRVDL